MTMAGSIFETSTSGSAASSPCPSDCAMAANGMHKTKSRTGSPGSPVFSQRMKVSFTVYYSFDAFRREIIRSNKHIGSRGDIGCETTHQWRTPECPPRQTEILRLFFIAVQPRGLYKRGHA